MSLSPFLLGVTASAALLSMPAQATTPWERPTAVPNAPIILDARDTVQLRLHFPSAKPASYTLHNRRSTDELYQELVLAQTTLPAAEVDMPTWLRWSSHRDIDGTTVTVLQAMVHEPVESRLEWQGDTLVWTMRDNMVRTRFWQQPLFWLGATGAIIGGSVWGLNQ